MLASPAAHMQAELPLDGGKAALQRTENARRDTRRMPVHPHHGAERLKPKRVRQATHDLLAAVVKDDRLDQNASEPRHAQGEPRWNLPTVKRKIGATGTTAHVFSI